jgi:peptide-methionine (S)-S-oxide reductase
MTDDTARATLAGGCFWCVEAPFKRIEGVSSVTSGYCGGEVDDPSYKQVCRGTTGHAEAVQIEYDPDVVGYADLLEVFFTVHDPTQLNRQGPDVGTQYRSAIFYHDDEQREIAEGFIDELEAAGVYDDDIVTEIAPLERFWEAEDYHQDYYEKNPNDAYCRVNLEPKLRKVKEKFGDRVEADD